MMESREEQSFTHKLTSSQGGGGVGGRGITLSCFCCDRWCWWWCTNAEQTRRQLAVSRERSCRQEECWSAVDVCMTCPITYFGFRSGRDERDQLLAKGHVATEVNGS